MQEKIIPALKYISTLDGELRKNPNKTQTIYVAEDGRRFFDKSNCEEYEIKIEAKKAIDDFKNRPKRRFIAKDGTEFGSITAKAEHEFLQSLEDLEKLDCIEYCAAAKGYIPLCADTIDSDNHLRWYKAKTAEGIRELNKCFNFTFSPIPESYINQWICVEYQPFVSPHILVNASYHLLKYSIMYANDLFKKLGMEERIQ